MVGEPVSQERSSRFRATTSRRCAASADRNGLSPGEAAASAPTSVDSGLDVATGDRHDGGAEDNGDPSGEDQSSGGSAENFAPRPNHGGEGGRG